MAGFGLIQQLSDGIGACCIARFDLGKVFPPNHTGWELRVLQGKHMQRRQGKLKKNKHSRSSSSIQQNISGVACFVLDGGKTLVDLLLSFLVAGN